MTLNAIMKKITGNMKRIIFLFFSILYIMTCSAQLSKFEGTWIRNYHTIAWNREIRDSKYELPITTIFRFQIIDGNVYIRGKEIRHYPDKGDNVEYHDIRDVMVKNDTITCKIFSHYEYHHYLEKDPPSNYQERVSYETIKFSRPDSAPWMEVFSISMTINYLLDGQVIQSQTIQYEDNDVPTIYYNEKDNW